MPKDKNNNQAMTEDEKFRSFFSTTAVNIPDEMTRRDEELPEEKPQKRFGLFARGKADQEEAQAAEPQEMPTGEVVLGGDAQPEQEADLELMLKPAADPEQELTDRWVVEQMSELTAMTASFVLATPTETDGALFPGRIMLANTCMWDYRGDECGYNGPAVADEFDNPTTDIRKDRCSKCMRGCEMRGMVANFGGFLSINKLSQ